MMLLTDILKDLPTLKTQGDLDKDVQRVTYDSRKVMPGDLFVALRGEHTDGHRYIRQAFERGAVAALVEEPVDAPRWIQVSDTLPALALAARKVYGDPAQGLAMVGVTGTNGKTTTTYLIESFGMSAGRAVGVLGTIEYRWPGFSTPAPHTTPFSSDLQEGLVGMKRAGVDIVAMEVSSHALSLHRVDTLEFDVAVLTNITQDHLDYHGTMENYAGTKLRLFTEHLKPKGRAVFNTDDDYGRKWAALLPHDRVLTYGFGTRAHVHPIQPRLLPDGIATDIEVPKGRFHAKSTLVGRHNLYNLLAAVSVGVALGYSLDQLEAAVSRPIVVPGRLEPVRMGQPFGVFVDYAHTPDGVLQVLRTLREIEHKRLICVLGCGGDRDRKKRPIMARTAQENAGWVILTSDNPRTEDPEAILDEMEIALVGRAGVNYSRIPDRNSAIEEAIRAARPGDIVLIAGKGHETYQEIHGVRHPFDDRLVAADALRQLGYEGAEA